MEEWRESALGRERSQYEDLGSKETKSELKGGHCGWSTVTGRDAPEGCEET